VGTPTDGFIGQRLEYADFCGFSSSSVQRSFTRRSLLLLLLFVVVAYFWVAIFIHCKPHAIAYFSLSQYSFLLRREMANWISKMSRLGGRKSEKY
jgi:hypothetical protein